MHYPSKLVEEAVNEISRLPGIGKKTALRLVLHILKSEEQFSEDLSEAIVKLRKDTKYCSKCHSISDNDVCAICTSNRREPTLICIVSDTKDVLAVENTAQYFGMYHVLGGVIDPLNGIGPSDLNIDSLLKRIDSDGVEEVIVALNPTMEGDTTTFYLMKKLKDKNIKVSSIARGIPVGGELEYADEITLGRSIITRTALSFDQ